MTAKFITIAARHYSFDQLERRLACSVDGPTSLLEGDEGQLWEREAAVLVHEDLYLDHVVFSAIRPLLGMECLKATVVAGPRRGDVIVASFRP